MIKVNAINMGRKKSKEVSIHELAVVLCENRNVWFHNHTVRLRIVGADDEPCYLCAMDSICDMSMVGLCSECSLLVRKPCLLELVVNQ